MTVSIPTALSSDLAVIFSNVGGDSYFYFSSAYAGSAGQTTGCTITAGSTSCNSTLLLCAGGTTNFGLGSKTTNVNVSAAGYVSAIVQVRASSN